MDGVIELAQGTPASTLVAVFGALLLVFGWRSTGVLQVVAVATPLVVGASTWYATGLGANALASGPVDRRAAGLARALDLGINAPLPHLLIAPLWAAALLYFAWGARAPWTRTDLVRLGAVLAVPMTRWAWEVHPRSFAGGYPNTIVFLTNAGALVVLARPEQRPSAAVVWSALVPLVLLVDQADTLLFPFVNTATLHPEDSVDRLARLTAFASTNHALLVLATALAYVPLAFTRPVLLLAAPVALASVWASSPVALLELTLEAYRP